jgi:hypothetical protein
MFLLSSLLSSNLFGQDFLPASPEDLMLVSLNLFEDTKKIVTTSPKKDCDNDEKKSKTVEPVQNNEIFCLCSLGGLKDEGNNILRSLLGDNITKDLTINTGNDNFLHGGFQLITGKQGNDGDDRGRTYSQKIDYSLLGDKGEFKISFDSTGFGKFTKVDGYTYSPSGNRYLNFREVNELEIEIKRNFSTKYLSKSYFIGDFKFTNETDSGHLSRSVQESWHNLARERMGTNTILYQYVNQNPTVNTTSIMAGVGKEFIANLGNWKCQTKLEAVGGMSVNMSGYATPEIAARAKNEITVKGLPWVALSSWIQATNGFKGTTFDTGVVLTFEKKINNVLVKPFIGIERHKSKMDRQFGVDGNAFENYHVLGVTIKY